MASSDVKPKSISRAKKWSEEIENLYRFQQAGYRDEIEYKQVKQVSMVRCLYKPELKIFSEKYQNQTKNQRITKRKLYSNSLILLMRRLRPRGVVFR